MLLPAKDTRYVLTYSLTTCEVSVYEVMLKRVIRRFKIRNPEYSREVEIEQELREIERLEEEERKKKKDLAASDSQDSLEDEEEDEDDDEDEEDKNSDEDAEQEGGQPPKLKRKRTKKEEEEEEINEKIKPFLELQSEQI